MRTLNFEKHWIFEHKPGTFEWRCALSLNLFKWMIRHPVFGSVIVEFSLSCRTCARMLEETVRELLKASTEVEEKVRRGVVDQDTAVKKKAESAQRNEVMAQIKGDRAERQVRVTAPAEMQYERHKHSSMSFTSCVRLMSD